MKYLITLLFLFPLIAYSQLSDNFEDNELTKWTQSNNTHWSISAISPPNNTNSLHHNFDDNQSGHDQISHPLSSINLVSGEVKWKFQVYYNYNPSSSNAWAVYLMSDQEADQMHPEGKANAYIIGVNFTNSDDIIKLWRFDGEKQIIINTNFNWQENVGTEKAASFEVTRSKNGTWQISIDTSSEQNQMINIGNGIDNKLTIANYFGIFYKYTQTADQKLWIDNISVEYISSNKNDNTTTIENPSNSIFTTQIPSTANNSDNAVDIFRFKISDAGTTDQLPTNIKQITIQNANPTNSADWINNIQEIRLSDGNYLKTQSIDINNDAIKVQFANGDFSISDGQSKEITMSVFLNDSNIQDNKNLQFKINKNNHNCLAYTSGSDFGFDFNNDILSTIISIDVRATKITTENLKSQVTIGNHFAIKTTATDNNGNIDTDINNSLTINLDTSQGILSSQAGLTQNLVDGEFTWSYLNYNLMNTFRINVFDNQRIFNTTQTSPITITGNADSKITSPLSSQTPSQIISSLADTPGEAVKVFRFTITDSGNGDAKPTYVNQLNFKNAFPSDNADWSNSIAEIILKDGSKEITIATPIISDSYIKTQIKTNELIIPDGQSKDIDLLIYLKKSKIEDKSKLKFKITAEEHYCIADNKGSIFTNNFDKDIISNKFTTEVKATMLSFAKSPDNVIKDQNFEIEINATDENKNIDFNANDNVTLQKELGNGQLSTASNLSQRLNKGTYKWADLTYNSVGYFSITAKTNDLDIALSDNIFSSTSYATIIAPENQITTQKISSLTDTITKATEVFKFSINTPPIEGGSPTIITQATIKNSKPNNTANWINTIQSVKLIDNITEINYQKIEITENEITIKFEENQFVIANGETKNITMSICLNRWNIEDNKTLQFYIDANDTDWKTSNLSTLIEEELQFDIKSEIFEINVEATELQFISQAEFVATNKKFAVVIAATDINGNIDINENNPVTLSETTENITNTPLTQNPVNGIIKFENLIASKISSFNLTATSKNTELAKAQSRKITTAESISTYLVENFENNNLDNWENTSDWITSEYKAINGNYSLKHNLAQTDGKSFIYHKINNLDLTNGITNWQFTISTYDLELSSQNRFVFYIAIDKPTDSNNTNITKLNGYAIGADLSASTKTLGLYQMKNSETDKILINSDFQFRKNSEVTIKVSRNQNGEWNLFYNVSDTIENFKHLGTALDKQFTTANYCGLFYTFTSTKTGKLHFDDLIISAINTPPVITSVDAVNKSTLIIEFSETVEKVSAEILANYSIKSESGNNIAIERITHDANNHNKIIISTSKIKTGNYKLTVNNIKDKHNNSMNEQSIAFSYPPHRYNVVINEIMIDPEPQIELPNNEYIELYNNTVSDVNMNGWTIEAGTNNREIENITIKPNEYLILCSETARENMQNLGKVAVVNDFPALVNSGQVITLRNNKGNIISAIEYSDKWYKDNYKAEGGWSLEQIDPANPCAGIDNWIASTNTKGGSPGNENSVMTQNSDIDAPTLNGFGVLSDTIIQLYFNESLDSTTLLNPLSYSINNSIGNPIHITQMAPFYNSVVLRTAKPLNPNTEYIITLTAQATDCVGNSIANNSTQKFKLPEPAEYFDVIINEILFNSYDSDGEFIEIYNRSDKAIDLSTLRIGLKDTETGKIEKMKSITDKHLLINPLKYLVLCKDAIILKNRYQAINSDAFIIVNDLPTLTNDNATIILTDKSEKIIDQVEYDEEMQFALLSDFKGVSLERTDFNRPSNENSNWHSASEASDFATPGYQNSQYNNNTETSNQITVKPEIFSPNNDGLEDIVNIHYNLPKNGYVANITIFDAKGKEIKRLINNELLGTEGIFAWDGINKYNAKANIGIYIIYIELFDLDGNIEKFKKTCVLGAKLN